MLQQPTHSTESSRTTALWALGLAFGAVLCGPFTAIPSILLSVLAIRSGDPQSRGRARFSLVLASALGIGWAFLYFLAAKDVDREKQEKVALAERAKKQRQAEIDSAKGIAFKKIEQAQIALRSGKFSELTEVVEWLIEFEQTVPPELAKAFAEFQLKSAETAFQNKDYAAAEALLGKFRKVPSGIESKAETLTKNLADAKLEVERLANIERKLAQAPKREPCGEDGGYFVCVDKVEKRVSISNSWSGYRAGQGSVFLLVKYRVSHNKKDSRNITWNEFNLSDLDKNQYSPDIGELSLTASMAGYSQLMLKQVNPRQAVSGWLIYSVPADALGLHAVISPGIGNQIELELPGISQQKTNGTTSKGGSTDGNK